MTPIEALEVAAADFGSPHGFDDVRSFLQTKGGPLLEQLLAEKLPSESRRELFEVRPSQSQPCEVAAAGQEPEHVRPDRGGGYSEP